MKLIRALFLSIILISSFAAAYAASEQSSGHNDEAVKASEMMGMHSDAAHEEVLPKNSVKLMLEPVSPLQANKTSQVIAKLSLIKNGKPLSFDDLKEAHTKKLHLLIVDPSLSDYHHIHPVAGKNPGEYVFDFMPLTNGAYRVWADVIPVSTDKQEYVQADMGAPSIKKPVINKTISMTSTVNGYNFTLALEGEPKVGSAVMGNVIVTRDGQPFTKLQPVMGAFAHVVGFAENYNSVLHIHPMGKEPTSDTELGGPKLEFHIEPKSAGFVKLFAQVQIDGKDIFAPFGIMVK